MTLVFSLAACSGGTTLSEGGAFEPSPSEAEASFSSEAPEESAEEIAAWIGGLNLTECKMKRGNQ